MAKAKKSRFTFDRKKLQKHFGRVRLQVFQWFGNDVRRAAKRRIKKPSKKRAESKPGESPVDRTGTLKKLIFYEIDPIRGVVIGPVQFKGRYQGAKALEYGGPSRAKVRGKWKKVVVKKRPFMQPALNEVKKTLPDKWKRAGEKFAGK